MQRKIPTSYGRKRITFKASKHGSAKDDRRCPLRPNIKDQRSKPRPVGLRRPLRVHEERQRLRNQVHRSKMKAARALDLQSALSLAGRSFTGAEIHPIAVNAWLSSDEPFHADMLRDALDAFTVELDALVDKFNNTGLSDTNLLANPLIDVPKGFGMQLICYSQDYGALITEAKKREGAFLHMGLKGKNGSNSERKHGFDPTEVLKRHAISFPPEFKTHLFTLSNAVHPLLQLERFHGCPTEIYEQLVPGLQLATKLLLHRSTAHFWHTVAFGERSLDQHLTVTNGHRCFRLKEPVPYSTEDAVRFANLMDSLTSTLHIHFSLWPLPKRAGLYAGMAIIPDYKRGQAHIPYSSVTENRRNCRICLHTDFYTTAQMLARLANPDPSLVLRFNLFVAVTVCHELAHFVEMNGAHEGARPENTREAYWGRESRIAEMGSAFEEAVFGGKVHPIGARVDCAWGCTVYDNPSNVRKQRRDAPTEKDLDSGGTIKNVGKTSRRRASSGAGLGLLCDLTRFSTVPMDYIARLQQKETWDAGKFDEDDLDAGTALLIPRDGAQAVSVPVFDMVVWDDEATNAVSDDHEKRDTPWRRLQDGSIVKTPLPKPQKAKSKEVSMADLDLDVNGA